MPADGYYELLGVEPHVSAAELGRAWRRLALQWHPDRAGPEATSTFQKLAAAYAVLSNPLARATYDRKNGISKPSAARTVEAPPMPRPRAPAIMLSRLTGSLESLTACGVAQRVALDMIELHVDEADAAQGGMATIAMNVDIRCPVCPQPPRPSCGRCAGTGKVSERFSAWLAVSPGVPDGTILTPSTPLQGMLHPVHFRVRTSVGG